jgi:hypothetical protein
MLNKDDDLLKSNESSSETPHEHSESTPEYDDEQPWRGVFTLPSERKVLFTMDVDLTNLPRWEPHIYIDPRWCEDDDE